MTTRFLVNKTTGKPVFFKVGFYVLRYMDFFEAHKNLNTMKSIFKPLTFLCLLILFSCEKSTVEEETLVAGDAIIGLWNLVQIDDEDVTDLDCYNDSYIESDGENISFYILDLNEDGSCTEILVGTEALTIEEDFYYIGDEAMDFTITGNTLTWRVNATLTLLFKR